MKTEDEEQTARATIIAASESASASTSRNNGRMVRTPSHFIGRHRLQAAISNLDQQIRIFQDELDELDSLGGPSTVCNELIAGFESAPDPLLPMTKGPVDISWERWFGGASSSSSSRSHRRWI